MSAAARLALALAAAVPPSAAMADTGRTWVHDTGFAITVDERASVEVAADGFHVLPEGDATLRAPPTVDIRFLHDPSGQAALGRTRWFGDISIDYAIVTVTEGSGGTEYTLTARRAMCGGVLEMQQHEQSEFGGTPGFEAGWQILVHAVCTPNDG